MQRDISLAQVTHRDGLRRQEACPCVGVSRSALECIIRGDELPTVKLTRKGLIRKETLGTWLRAINSRVHRRRHTLDHHVVRHGL